MTKYKEINLFPLMAECRLLTIYNRNGELKEKMKGRDNVRLISFLERAQFLSLLAADPGSIISTTYGSKQPEMIPGLEVAKQTTTTKLKNNKERTSFD